MPNQWKPTPISDEDWNAINTPVKDDVIATDDVTNNVSVPSKADSTAPWQPQPINDDEWNNIISNVGEIKTPEVQVDEDTSDFIPGVKRGIDQLQAMGYGAAALTGSLAKKAGLEDIGQAAQDFGMEGYQRNIEEAKEHPKKYSFKDVYTGEVGLGGAIDWAQGTLGELVPSMAEAAVGAAIGSMVAPGVGTAAGGLAGRTVLKKGIDKIVKEGMKKGIGDLTEDQLRKQVTKQALKKMGGKVGIGAAVMPLESGGNYAELLESHGVDAPETALLFGGLATSLEFLGGNSKLVDVFIDSLAKGSKGLAKKSAKEILSNIPQEALQEGGQELLSILNTVVNTDEELLTAENLEQVIESMGAGAVGGGAGAVANVAMARDQKAVTDTEQVDTVEQETAEATEEIEKTPVTDEELKVATDQLGQLESDVSQASQEDLFDDMVEGQVQLSDQTAVRNRQRQFEALQAQDTEQRTENQVNQIEEQLAELRPIFHAETDPIEKEGLRSQILGLMQARNQLKNIEAQKAQETQQVQEEEQQVSQFDQAKTAEELRQEQEDLYGDLFAEASAGLAEESAQAFRNPQIQIEQNENQIDQLFEESKNLTGADKRNVLQKIIALNQQNNQLTKEVGTFERASTRTTKRKIDSNNVKIEELNTRRQDTKDPEQQTFLDNEINKLRNENAQLESSFIDEQQVASAAQFETNQDQKPKSKINLEDIQKTFPGQEIVEKDGITYIFFKNGKGVGIQQVKAIDGGFVEMIINSGQMKKSGTIIGVTQGNKITLNENFADNNTLWHENKHALDNLGIITPADDSALNKEFNKLRKANKLGFAASTHKDPMKAMEENRARMFAQIMVNREQYRDTPFGKVIQRVMDFFNQLLAFGKQSISGLAREIESGKIYERQVNKQTVQTIVPQTETIANEWYSTLENVVDGFQQKQATPDQWKGMIKNYPGIKQEELDWMGLNEWLGEQKGKVSKNALLKFVQENNIQLEEVVKAGKKELENKINDQLKSLGYHYTKSDDLLNLIDPDGNSIYEVDAPKEVRDIINNLEDRYDYLAELKYENYQLPGGENYKELLITTPRKQTSLDQDSQRLFKKNFVDLSTDEQTKLKDYYNQNNDYKSSHFDEPNILAHVRFNERTDADGNRVLFLEEVQSDWHQAGRKKGYQKPLSEKQRKDLEDKIVQEKQMLQYAIDSGRVSDESLNETKKLIIAMEETLKGNIVGDVPDAPFKKTWPLLAMKRMVRYAAENGFDKIAWTTGQQQADRYGEENIQAEGMKAFYDKMLPSIVNKEFNRGKWGKAKVKPIEISGNQDAFMSKGAVLQLPFDALSLSITDRMKNKALREGMPMFETVEQKLPQAEYDEIYNEKNNLLQNIVQTSRINFNNVKMLADKAFGSISTRLNNINPLIMYKMRDLDYRISQKIISALKTAKPLLEATKKVTPAGIKMSKQDKSAWDWARKNSDEGKIQQIAEKYGLVEQQEKLRDVLNQIREDAIDVGYDVGFIDEYWPRIIKDQEGFLQATQEISEQPVFTNAFKAQAKKLGITLEKFNRDYPEVKADIISNIILGKSTGIAGPGNIQGRVYETIPKEFAKFYMDSDAALMSYIYSLTKKIESRRFFGKTPKKIQQLKTQKKQKQTALIKAEQLVEISEANDRPELADYEARVAELTQDIKKIDQDLNKYKFQRDYTENIGSYIDDLMTNGKVHKKDENTLKNILNARFNEHGTTGIVNAYKNFAYIDTMGSPISALTQIGDLAWAMYAGKVWTPKGFSDTIKNTVKAVLGRSNITKEDLGFERIAQEFADGTTLGKAVSKVFNTVGLTKMDSIGKEVLINNALSQYQAQASSEIGRKQLLKDFKPIFGPQSNEVINDLLATDLATNPSDNVKFLLYSKVLDFQPMALSEMPELYLNSGNGRVFYMLKTYTLKQFDVFRREVFNEIKDGAKNNDPKKIVNGVKNMTQLMALLTLANAGADELKDFMLGKETKFQDHVIENFLTMGGASRYMRMQVTREGIGSAAGQQILPPFKFFNALSKDVSGDVENLSDLKTIESIPVGGKLFYWHHGKGAGLKKTQEEQDFSKAGKKMRKIKKDFDKAEDKRLFITSNLDAYKQMKIHQNFQAALNRNKAVINKLEKIPQTANVRKRTGQLQEQRRILIDRYFTVTKGMDN